MKLALSFVTNGRARLLPSREADPDARLGRSLALPNWMRNGHLGQRLAPTFSRQTSRTRSGSSLVEIMAAMAGNTAIIGLAVVSLIALGRADRTFRDRADSRRMVSQLADQLREDIHAAEQIAWDAKQRTLRLTLPGGEAIAYHGEKQQWARRTISKSVDGEGELAGAFAAPPRFRLQVEPKGAAAGETVTIIFTIRSHDRPDDDRVAAELVAEVGRDRRLLHE